MYIATELYSVNEVHKPESQDCWVKCNPAIFFLGGGVYSLVTFK